MIKRDKHGIIIQHDNTDKTYEDGGDSAARMGISALENQSDVLRLVAFLKPNGPSPKLECCGLVRHPYQEQWNDVKKTSRDQVVQFCVSGSIGPKIAADYYSKKLFINKDIIMPDVRLYLYKVSGNKIPLWVKIIGPLFLWLSLFWSTKIKPEDEINQFACICLVAGKVWVERLYKWHPHLEGNILLYWEGWRDQKEIGDILITALLKKTAPDISR